MGIDMAWVTWGHINRGFRTRGLLKWATILVADSHIYTIRYSQPWFVHPCSHYQGSKNGHSSKSLKTRSTFQGRTGPGPKGRWVIWWSSTTLNVSHYFDTDTFQSIYAQDLHRCKFEDFETTFWGSKPPTFCNFATK